MQKIDAATAINIFDERKPRGRFYVVKDRCYTAIDNSNGDAWTEDFFTEEMCCAYLEHERYLVSGDEANMDVAICAGRLLAEGKIATNDRAKLLQDVLEISEEFQDLYYGHAVRESYVEAINAFAARRLVELYKSHQ